MHAYVERLVDLLDPDTLHLTNMDADEARRRVGSGDPDAVREIEGSFALVARDGRTVRMARSLDRPMRYFLAKRAEGPALLVADRIDTLYTQLVAEGLEDQFHPSYTRMVPAHHIVEIQLVGCPDPDPLYTRFFTPPRNTLGTDLDTLGAAYVGAASNELERHLRSLPADAPLGVAFSGGIDSGAVFLLTHAALLRLGQSPARLKAFTLDLGDAPDRAQAFEFLDRLGLGLFWEPVEGAPADLDTAAAVQVIEDYKPLDVECAAMNLALYRTLRARYPDWRHMLDGDGGDENLKDYPIEENPELTIRSVVNNLMLYQEGWGVGRIKHSLTYSGGLSRACVRGYAPARRHGFETFSPFTQPSVIAVAEGIPFDALTEGSVERLYALKGEIVARGVRAVTGIDMPIFPKRRFQHGAVPAATLRERLPERETALRRRFLALYA